MSKIKKLDNNLKLVTSPMPHMESVAIGIFIGMGGRYEERKLCGISHFIEHMLFKGTYSRDARKLKESIEGVGGHFNGFTSEEITCYLVKVPAKHMLLGLDVLSDMVLNPKMDPSEIEKEKKVICEEIKMYRDQPSSYVHEILASVMWPEHPLGRSLAGSEDTVMSFDRNNIMHVKESFYQPSNIAIVTTGNIHEKNVVSAVDEMFGLKKKVKTPQFRKFENKQRKKALKLHYKDTEQTHLNIGFHTFGRKTKQRYTLHLLNIILGANMSSRLFEELREKRGLCYDVSSSVKKYDDTGAFFIHAGIDNKKVEETVTLIMDQVAKVKAFGVHEDELVRAKEYFKGQMLLAFEDTGSRMLWLGDRVMTRDGIPDISKIMREVEKLDVNDIKKIANMVFDNNSMNLAAIGPKDGLKRSRIEKLMEIK